MGLGESCTVLEEWCVRWEMKGLMQRNLPSFISGGNHIKMTWHGGFELDQFQDFCFCILQFLLIAVN